MAVTLNANTSTGFIATSDTSGVLQLQTAGTTAVSIGTDQSFNFSATGQRITGDFSNATIANRVAFQSSTTNGNTNITTLTNGTATASGIQCYNTADPTNSSFANIGCSSTEVQFLSAVRGTGTYLPMTFYTNGSERARIDTSGNLLVGTTDAGTASGVGLKLLASPTIPAFATVFNTASASQGAYLLYNTNATNNGFRFYVQANGGIVNYSANNINVSDERTKTDVQNAGNYLAKICAIPVRTFKYKDQDSNLLTLGVIAQEVESIAPELVSNEGFGETPEDGIPLKSIYQTDLQYALMKCIQEQQALITQLQADVAALKGATP